MLRKIISIDQPLCNGCGLCVSACHEGAIGLVNGKATLLRDDYCDGLGNCLPVCPTGAITFEEREAAAFDQAAVEKSQAGAQQKLSVGCPGSHAKAILREPAAAPSPDSRIKNLPSQLRQWPVQLKLIPVNAAYFEGASLLVAADCAAYACGSFHSDFMKDKITLIGCPKLDEGDYAEKLTAILKGNNIKSLTVVRMQVPCCGGLENAAKTALKDCGRLIPWEVAVISTDGQMSTSFSCGCPAT